VHIDVRFARRGRKVLVPPRVAVRDPFGLMVRLVRGASVDADEVLILPRIEPVRTPGAGGDGSGSLQLGRRSSVAAEIELDGLRQARAGTSASRMYWPSLAKGGELLERRLRADSDTRPLVVLDPRAPASEEDLDAAVRAAASLTLHFARRQGCALLLPGDRRANVVEPDLLGWPQAHVRLALVGDHTGPSLVAAQNRRGLVMLVAARPLDRPPRGLGRTPGGCLLIVPSELPGRRAVIEVSGCFGYVATRTGAAAALAATSSGAG